MQTVGPSLALSLEPMAHCWNVASLSLFYRYCFGRCSLELAQLVPLLFSQGGFTRYSDRLHDFSVTISRCYKDLFVNSFFPCTARLWNSLPIECFPLAMILVALKSDSCLPNKIPFICLNESPLKMMKNAFYFILKTLFVLEIFKFLSWLFNHAEKTAWLER